MAHFNWPIKNKTFEALDTPFSRSSHSHNKSTDILSWMALLYRLWEFNLGQIFWITQPTRVHKLPRWHYQLYESTDLVGYKTLTCVSYEFLPVLCSCHWVTWFSIRFSHLKYVYCLQFNVRLGPESPLDER
jgi:hypothetical protein